MNVIAHRCAVLGKPIAHSLSPVLHNAAYKALGLDDWAYERHEVGESDLDGFLKGLDPTWCGLSLTMPLKKTIQPYGTPSNMWAQRLKVANTAIFDWPAEPGITPGATPDGASATGSLPAIRLYNTDVMGIVLAFDHELKALGEPDRWKSATSAAVIGNGNTAASAVAACTVMLKNGQTNKRITVAARHPGKNRQLPDIIGEGDAIAKPQNIEVPIGTLYRDVIDACGGVKEGVELGKIIFGGPMMGGAAPSADFPVLKQNNGLLLFSKKAASLPEPSACIRCGRCIEACPMGLEPVVIAQDFANKDFAALKARCVDLCVACGSCTYACPAKRPVSQTMGLAKGWYMAELRKGGK